MSTLIEYLKVGNVEIYNAKEITKQFGKYFSTVGEKYAQQIPKPNKSTYQCIYPKNTQKPIYYIPHTNKQIGD